MGVAAAWCAPRSPAADAPLRDARLGWGNVLGLVVGAVMVMNVVSRPETEQLTGVMLAWAVLWRGVVYGAVDGLLFICFSLDCDVAGLRCRVSTIAEKTRGYHCRMDFDFLRHNRVPPGLLGLSVPEDRAAEHRERDHGRPDPRRGEPGGLTHRSRRDARRSRLALSLHGAISATSSRQCAGRARCAIVPMLTRWARGSSPAWRLSRFDFARSNPRAAYLGASQARQAV